VHPGVRHGESSTFEICLAAPFFENFRIANASLTGLPRTRSRRAHLARRLPHRALDGARFHLFFLGEGGAGSAWGPGAAPARRARGSGALGAPAAGGAAPSSEAALSAVTARCGAEHPGRRELTELVATMFSDTYTARTCCRYARQRVPDEIGRHVDERDQV